MKKSAWVAIVAALALCMVVSSSAQPSLAYLTTYTEAKGSVTVSYDPTDTGTRIDEEVEGWVKTVNVENTGTEACFVRVRAFAGQMFSLAYSTEGEGWYDGGDGYWYYKDPLEPGSRTAAPLTITISGPAELPEEFNVIVVQECAPVIYTEDGTATADWSLARQTTDEGAVSE